MSPYNSIEGHVRTMKFLRQVFRLQRRLTKGAPLLRAIGAQTATGMSYRDAIAHLARKYRRLRRG